MTQHFRAKTTKSHVSWCLEVFVKSIVLGMCSEYVQHNFSIHSLQYPEPAITHKTWISSSAIYDTVLIYTDRCVSTNQNFYSVRFMLHDYYHFKLQLPIQGYFLKDFNILLVVVVVVVVVVVAVVVVTVVVVAVVVAVLVAVVAVIVAVLVAVVAVIVVVVAVALAVIVAAIVLVVVVVTVAAAAVVVVVVAAVLIVVLVEVVVVVVAVLVSVVVVLYGAVAATFLCML